MKFLLGSVLVAASACLCGSVQVPRISETDFETWYSLASQADREAEVNHEAPPFTRELASLGKDDGEPYQGHIVLGDTPREMRIMWAAKGKATTPTVLYGLSSDHLSLNASGTAATYGPDDMCGAKDEMDGFSYQVLLQGLAPSTTYHYRFGSWETDMWSKKFSFRTPHAPGTEEAKSVRFIAYGDMGYFDSGKRVAEMIEEDELEKAEFIMHVGDISYADGEDKYWDEFMDQIEPIAAHLPYFVNIGNHEVDDGECGVPYNTRFTMPTNGLPDADKTRNLWYSFNWGPVHLVQMSTEHDFTRGSPQWKFLESDLRSVNRSETPWVIFTGHRMMYSEDAGSFGEGMREELEDLLMEHQVDLAWWGHAHQYERTCAVYREKCVEEFDKDDEITDPGAPVHIVMGMAGRNYQYAAKQVGAAAEWEDIYEEELGYTRISADHQELKFKFIREKDGDTVDSFTIFKKGGKASAHH